MLEWIRYHLPNKKDLINRLDQAVIFSKFDLKMIKEQSISKSLNLLHSKNNHLKFLKDEVKYKKIEEELTNSKLQSKIEDFAYMLFKEVCSDLPHAFWHRKRHIVRLLYAKEFKKTFDSY